MSSNIETFAIVGAGFGLYGYLPALVRVLGAGLILPEKYRGIISSRRELKQFDRHIDWQPSIAVALKKATGVVIAIPPKAQLELMQEILSLENIKKIIIEKPVAPNVDDATQLVEGIVLKSKKFRVGYTFIYSDWYPLLRELIANHPCKLKIIWRFKADHIVTCKETWKRYHSLGGGVLRFYGIHLIAVLASLGYEIVINSALKENIRDQPSSWEALFSGKNLPRCEVSVSINSDRNDFLIEGVDKDNRQRTFYSAGTPFFLSKNTGDQDVRVPILEGLIKTFEFDDFEYISLYRSINNLWKKVELSSEIQVVK